MLSPLKHFADDLESDDRKRLEPELVLDPLAALGAG